MQEQKLHDDLLSAGKGLVFANLLKGNDFKTTNFYESSITNYYKKKEEPAQKGCHHRHLVETIISRFVSTPLTICDYNTNT